MRGGRLRRVTWALSGLLLAFAGAPTPEADGRAAARPWLWVVEDTPRFYLFGTLHVPDSRVTALPPVVRKAMDASQLLLTELPMSRQTQTEFQRLMRLPPGRRLDRIGSPTLYRRVRALLPGTPERELRSTNVMGIWVRLARRQMQKEMGAQFSRTPLDALLARRFLEAGKPTSALEAVAEQNVFARFSTAEKVQLLETTVAATEELEREGRRPVKRLIDLYLAGDVAKLNAFVLEDYDAKDPLQVRLRKAIIDERNARMVKRILARRRANPERVVFVAVGAAHLGGETGIVRQLKARGLAVRRLGAGEAVPR